MESQDQVVGKNQRKPPEDSKIDAKTILQRAEVLMKDCHFHIDPFAKEKPYRKREPVKKATQLAVDPRCVSVSDVPSGKTEEVLELFFKNKKKCGGVEVITRVNKEDRPPTLPKPLALPKTLPKTKPKIAPRSSPNKFPLSVLATNNIRVESTREGMTITVKPGSLDVENVDMLVNTTTKDLQLNSAGVSGAIFHAAGPTIQQECAQQAPQGVSHGGTVVTSGGNLNARFICHGSCGNWDSGAGHSEKHLRCFVQNAMAAAENQGCGSIAFPAIGTGQDRYPADFVARIMLEEITGYSSSHPQTSVKDVRIVLLPSDQHNITAFHQLGSPSVASRPKTTTLARKPGKDGTVCSLVDNTDSVLSARFGSVFFTLKNGNITQEGCDAIVSSTNSTLDLKSGAFSNAILQAGGQQIEQDCQFYKTLHGKLTDLMMTGSGNLPCQKVIHINAPHSSGGWEKILNKTFTYTDSQGLSSIVFPVVGTGGQNEDAVKMADVILRAVTKFSVKNNPQHLKDIYVIVFDQPVFDVFKKQMVKEITGVGTGLINKYVNKPPTLPKPSTLTQTLAKTSSRRSPNKFPLSALATNNVKVESTREGMTKSVKPGFLDGENKAHLKDQSTMEWGGNYGKHQIADFTKEKERKVGNPKSAVTIRRTTKDSGTGTPRISSTFPIHWKAMGEEEFYLVPIQRQSAEYQEVAKAIKGIQILKIERLQNPEMYELYQTKKKHMSKSLGNACERTLYHGTSADSLKNINANGMNRNYSGKNATAYGNGVYFAVDFKYSAQSRFATPDQNGHRYIYQCKVLVGEFTQGAQDMKEPPLKNPASGTRYNSVVDRVQSPTMFIVFHDAQVYPEYIITI